MDLGSTSLTFSANWGLWVGFLSFIALLLSLDLGVFNRRLHVVRFKEALFWTLFWVLLAGLFNLGLWFKAGREVALEFLTGYLIEKSLSIDNLFVFVLIFTRFKIPKQLQHRVLFWGIVVAIVLRGLLIFAGVLLLSRFHWLIYVFGAFLIYSGVKLFLDRHKAPTLSLEDNLFLRGLRRLFPCSSTLEGSKFWVRVREGGKLRWMATPLFLALLLVELGDVIFALDSIPAILAITRNQFIVFTSNIFAILGLRSLFFMLAEVMERFSYLKVALMGILIFVGLKMLLAEVFPISAGVSLLGIGVMIAIAIIFSLRSTRSGVLKV